MEGWNDRGADPVRAHHGAGTHARRSPKGRSASPGTRSGVASSGRPRGEDRIVLGGLTRRGGSGRHGTAEGRGDRPRQAPGLVVLCLLLKGSPTDTGHIEKRMNAFRCDRQRDPPHKPQARHQPKRRRTRSRSTCSATSRCRSSTTGSRPAATAQLTSFSAHRSTASLHPALR